MTHRYEMTFQHSCLQRCPGPSINMSVLKTWQKKVENMHYFQVYIIYKSLHYLNSYTFFGFLPLLRCKKYDSRAYNIYCRLLVCDIIWHNDQRQCLILIGRGMVFILFISNYTNCLLLFFYEHLWTHPSIAAKKWMMDCCMKVSLRGMNWGSRKRWLVWG